MSQVSKTKLAQEAIPKTPSTPGSFDRQVSNFSETVTHSYFQMQATKPLMEKRRRERMNKALNEMKNLLLEVMGRDVSLP